MTVLFFLVFIVLILAELIKGLSANGTPPVLQKFSWQLGLAHFMWTHIMKIRIILAVELLALFLLAPAEERLPIIIGGILLGLVWYGVYWLFNKFWCGKYKFLPLTNPNFVSSADNTIDPKAQVIGISHNGVQKAYPVNMLFYHHQIPGEIGGHPTWATYCGLCRSGRIYDRLVDGQALDFALIGAITFNATFKDTQTGSWWRQETGEAVKGPHSGKSLEDMPTEQMTLENWLAKYPDSEILQYDPAFQKKYNFIGKLLNYEASLPGWHRQETPPLIIGVETGGSARAYDWNELQQKRLVNDELGTTSVLVLSAEDNSSAFVYERTVQGETLTFELNADVLTDSQTQSVWNQFGQCTAGELAGTQLTQLQSYQQFLRGWVDFRPGTDFYDFNARA